MWEQILKKAQQQMYSSAQSAKRGNDIMNKFESGGFTTESTYPNQFETPNFTPNNQGTSL